MQSLTTAVGPAPDPAIRSNQAAAQNTRLVFGDMIKYWAIAYRTILHQDNLAVNE